MLERINRCLARITSRYLGALKIERPGRVATLVEDPQGVTWGRVFRLRETSSKEAEAYLDSREAERGEYSRLSLCVKSGSVIIKGALTYVASSNNPLYLGPAPLPKMAEDIATSSGTCGHNAEYLLRLADFMQKAFPDVLDDHLFSLERLVRTMLRHQGKSISDMIPQEEESPSREEAAEKSLSQFAAQIPSRKLRCMGKVLKLQTSDGEIIALDSEIAMKMEAVKSLSVDHPDLIPLHIVSSAILKHIIGWLIYHKDDPPFVPEPIRHLTNLPDEIPEWDGNFLKEKDEKLLCELSNSVSLLIIPALEDLLCTHYANLIKTSWMQRNYPDYG
ncbi:CHAC1 [Cordylochernes scorpioides]|uniref:glutathione-specific gamma-glutamylcyclotransferase n=1 Tax=Cordylochernes scorpioides TaxID=51811 RepID=A0ABY6KJC5_9ARAC|nr:CHAC1 [Cordylochernes scorpioides]